jgi:hypothetical protein
MNDEKFQHDEVRLIDRTRYGSPKVSSMEWDGWMHSTRYHDGMAERLDLNIGVWREDSMR